MVRVGDVIREIRLRTLVALFWFASVALPLFAQAPPVRDTFVVPARPESNLGANAPLVAQSGTRSLLQFSLSFLPNGGNAGRSLTFDRGNQYQP